MNPQFVRPVVMTLFLLAVQVVSPEVFDLSAKACDFPNMTWSNLFSNSWEPNASVHVYIDQAFDSVDRAQLATGILNWNFYKDADCSGVEFYGFDTMDFSQIPTSQLPPDYTVWVVRQNCPLTQYFIDGNPVLDGQGNPMYVVPQACTDKRADPPFGRVTAQKIRISLATNNIPSQALLIFW